MYRSVKLDLPGNHNNRFYIIKLWTGRRWEEIFRSRCKSGAVASFIERMQACEGYNEITSKIEMHEWWNNLCRVQTLNRFKRNRSGT